MAVLLLASNNRGKLDEMNALLAHLKIELLTPSQLALQLEIEEHGSSYTENATLKARAFARAAGVLTMADDSGLEVDALGGAPGIHSARYAPQTGATDGDCREYLLRNLASKPRPWSAQFRCVIALVSPGDEQVHFAEGVCPGEIIPEERGDQGFGYDPIFLLPEFGRTMAEMSMQEKNHLSHRARAIRNAQPILLELLSKMS